MKNMLKIAAAVTAITTALAVTPAFAVTGNLAVSANVANGCTAASGSLNFGTVDPANANPTNVTGLVSITCNNGIDYVVQLNGGIKGLVKDRFMENAGETGKLNYALYTDSGHTQMWGDGTAATVTVAGTGSGSQQDIDVYGQIAANQQNVPDGAYSDTVLITVITQ